jgi:hypothetical protein
MSTGKADPKALQADPWRVNEEARRRQLRDDGRRPLAVNLAEGLALSEFLSNLPEGGRSLSDMEARELFRVAQQDSVSGD